MTYTHLEHRHRFAAWAAGRAASTQNCRFTVEVGRSLLESTDIPAYAAKWEAAAETSEEFDARHQGWRDRMIVQATARGVGAQSKIFTHGIAAKLINVYLKSMVVCSLITPSNEAYFRAAVIHPPIDRLLLRALGKYAKLIAAKPKRGRSHWQDYADLGWSNFTSEQYEEVIRAIRTFSNGRPLWLVEEHWLGHQTGRRTNAIQTKPRLAGT